MQLCAEKQQSEAKLFERRYTHRHVLCRWRSVVSFVHLFLCFYPVIPKHNVCSSGWSSRRFFLIRFGERVTHLLERKEEAGYHRSTCLCIDTVNCIHFFFTSQHLDSTRSFPSLTLHFIVSRMFFPFLLSPLETPSQSPPPLVLMIQSVGTEARVLSTICLILKDPESQDEEWKRLICDAKNMNSVESLCVTWRATLSVAISFISTDVYQHLRLWL